MNEDISVLQYLQTNANYFTIEICPDQRKSSNIKLSRLNKKFKIMHILGQNMDNLVH